MTFDPILLDHAQAEVMALTGSINELMDEAAGHDDPAVFVPVLAILEAERDVAIRLVALERAKQRLDEAQAALEALAPAAPDEPSEHRAFRHR